METDEDKKIAKILKKIKVKPNFGLTAVADQMYSRWADSKDIIYSFSKTRFMLAKRFHLKPVKKDKSDIWDQF